MRNILFIAGIIFILCSSFKKEKSILSDYRDIYVGSFFCVKNCQVVNSSYNGLNINSDTLTIYVRKDSKDSILDVSIGKSVYPVKLSSGNMMAYPNGHWGGVYYSVDSLGFSTVTSLAPSGCSYVGKRSK
jgi:hypothetical protein